MSNKERDLKGIQRPQEAEENFSKKQGIDLFFGELEANFFDQVGKEMTVNILKESFILYRVDLRRTKTHVLYGESIIKETKDPIEVFARINVEVGDPTYRTQRGVSKQGMGELKASLHLSHLEELGLLHKDGDDIDIDMKKGDYIAYKGQFYEIWDDGYAQIANQFSYASDRRAFLTIKAKEVDRDVFNAV
jgi:hypothetical protein